MLRRVEGVGGEDEVVGCVWGWGFFFAGFKLVVVVVAMLMEGPIERAGRDGAVGGGEGCVLRDVVLEVWDDGGEVGEVGGGCEEGGCGEADEAGAGAEFEDAGTCGGRGW